MYGHELHGILPSLRLVVARFQGSVGEEGGKWREGFAIGQNFLQNALCSVLLGRCGGRAGAALGGWCGVGCCGIGGAGVDLRHGCGVAPKAFEIDETFCCVYQLLQVFYAVGAIALVAVVLQQAAGVKHKLDDFFQAAGVRLFAHDIEFRHKRCQVSACFAAYLQHGIV